ncbi:MAG TPA: cation:proton antiporter [Spirochaetota bacterium]|nr:cation:proton antiporter [Spirochaetota bacterium]
MQIFDRIYEIFTSLSLPALLLVGVMTIIGLYAGKSMKWVRMPSIIGFMLVGVIIGPSLFNILDEPLQKQLSFITEIALGFVALSIGLELNFKSLKELGAGIIVIIICESFFAFFAVTAGLFLLTGDLALALTFGAIAPASAPAGTVAVIQEYRAHGSLTKALYAVVGFDDGLGIIIFGFVAAFVRRMIVSDPAGGAPSILATIMLPLKEVGLSVLVGSVAAFFFSMLFKKLKSARDIFILIFASVLIITGISTRLHLSLILTNMVYGIVLVNTQRHTVLQKMRDELSDAMPLFFVLFFTLAGSNLHVLALPSLGLVGMVYIVARTSGLMGGAWFGSLVGRSEKKIRRYLGMGILSQAGVAIGLALIVKQEFGTLGGEGARIGSAVITSITATCIFFEILGPILTKIGLKRAGEIQADQDQQEGF